jgi:hypothetical protein
LAASHGLESMFAAQAISCNLPAGECIWRIQERFWVKSWSTGKIEPRSHFMKLEAIARPPLKSEPLIPKDAKRLLESILGRFFGLFVLVLLAVPGTVFAQGSGSHSPVSGGAPQGAPGSNNGDNSRAFAVNDDMKGRITSINAATNLIAVEDKKGKVHTFKIAAQCKLKADKKSELGEKQDLSLKDFQVGQPVKVVYRASDSAAMEVKLLPK